MPSILILSSSEISYNTRLLKAAYFFQDSGFEVTVFNPITGLCSEEVYRDTLKNKSWNLVERNLSKRSFSSKLRWLYVSLVHLLFVKLNQLGISIGNKYYLNKMLLSVPRLEPTDFILIHLVDNLPFAAQLKKKWKSKLIYDSQEYFVGQYAGFENDKHQWVKQAEKKYIKYANLILSTTNVMKDRLIKDYELSVPVIRVRNVPLLKDSCPNLPSTPQLHDDSQPTKLVWHGMSIVTENRRGIHILLEAISLCNENVELHLQGHIKKEEKKTLKGKMEELDIVNKVFIHPAASPDKIVNSLIAYDVGLTAELVVEENQELTSSNKLFDYINAGLAVISSNTKGLAETVEEYKVGYLYNSGNASELASMIDKLSVNKEALNDFKRRSLIAKKELYWESEYREVLQFIQ